MKKADFLQFSILVQLEPMKIHFSLYQAVMKVPDIKTRYQFQKKYLLVQYFEKLSNLKPTFGL
jgi:hypothetical protein